MDTVLAEGSISSGKETGTGKETGRVDLGGRPPRSPTDPDLRGIIPPLSHAPTVDGGQGELVVNIYSNEDIIKYRIPLMEILLRVGHEPPQPPSFLAVGPNNPRSSRLNPSCTNFAVKCPVAKPVVGNPQLLSEVWQPPFATLELFTADRPPG